MKTPLATLDKRRAMLKSWHERFGTESLLDMCATDLNRYTELCRQLKHQLYAYTKRNSQETGRGSDEYYI